MQGAIDYVKERAAKTPNSFVAGQFENQANPDFHYETTARELYEQMAGRLTPSSSAPAPAEPSPAWRAI